MKNNKLLTVLLLLLIAITLVGVITLVIFLNTDSRSVEGSEPSIDEIVKASVEVPEITTNLADDGFIKISFTIQTDSTKGKKELEKSLFQVTNLIISELSELEQADFDGKNGQDQGSYKTQQEAMKKGRKMAMETSCEFVVHGRDGKIRLSQSYGNDPKTQESDKKQSKTQNKSSKNNK